MRREGERSGIFCCAYGVGLLSTALRGVSSFDSKSRKGWGDSWAERRTPKWPLVETIASTGYGLQECRVACWEAGALAGLVGAMSGREIVELVRGRAQGAAQGRGRRSRSERGQPGVGHSQHSVEASKMGGRRECLQMMPWNGVPGGWTVNLIKGRHSGRSARPEEEVCFGRWACFRQWVSGLLTARAV